jgi:hypothetical protein
VYVSVVDWNDDSVHDLLVGDASGYIHVYLNKGSTAAPLLQEGFQVMMGDRPISVRSRAAPDLVDINGDGRKDLMVGGKDGFIMIYPDTGNQEEPRFSGSYKMSFKDGRPINVGTRSAPRFFDWDNDGLKDLLIGEAMGYVYFIKDTGSKDKPVFLKAERLRLEDGRALRYPLKGARSRLTVADWDGDRIPDIILGGMDGRVMLFRGTGEPLRIKRREWIKMRLLERFKQ